MYAGQLLPPRSPPVPLPEATHSWGPASALAISVLPGLGPGWIFRAHLNALFHLILSPSRGDLERDLLPRLRWSCPCLCLASLECPSSRQCPRCSGLVAGLGQVHVGTRRGPPFCVSWGSIESSPGRTPPSSDFHPPSAAFIRAQLPGHPNESGFVTVSLAVPRQRQGDNARALACVRGQQTPGMRRAFPFPWHRCRLRAKVKVTDTSRWVKRTPGSSCPRRDGRVTRKHFPAASAHSIIWNLFL